MVSNYHMYYFPATQSIKICPLTASVTYALKQFTLMSWGMIFLASVSGMRLA